MIDNSSLASDPKFSVFVSANAGTGKTRALTHRVFRLLLNGVMPDSILCVTYTKAAAAEMQQRLQNTLSRWAVCSESELISDLTEMSEPNPSQEKILISRHLIKVFQIIKILKHIVEKLKYVKCLKYRRKIL